VLARAGQDSGARRDCRGRRDKLLDHAPPGAALRAAPQRARGSPAALLANVLGQSFRHL
jgi:hypothetical protein